MAQELAGIENGIGDEVTFSGLLRLCGGSLSALKRKEITPKEAASLFGGVRATVSVIRAEMSALQMIGRSPTELLALLPPQEPKTDVKK